MKIQFNVLLGIIAGFINCIAWYLFSNIYSPINISQVDRQRFLTTLCLLILGIITSIYVAQKKNNGFIDFKEGVKTGILYTLVLGIILAAFSYIYYHFIAPEAIEHYVAENLELARKDGKLKPEQLPTLEKNIRSFFNPFKIFMSTLILGVIMSFLTSSIFRMMGKK